MAAPPYIRPGCTRRLELDWAQFAVATYILSTAEVGKLFQMLMAEVGQQPIPRPRSAAVSSAFAARDRYRKIRGSFSRQSIPLAVRVAVFARDSGACRYCSRALAWRDYHCDHVRPISKGGSDSLRNLAASCERCNRSKGAKLLTEWAR